jgi:hypothetical protein
MYGLTDSGAVVAFVLKAGFQSMRHALRCNGDEITQEFARAAPVRVQFVRQPGARLVSAYRHYKTIYLHGSTPQPGEPQPIDVATWDAFMAHVLANDNAHWRPQYLIAERFCPNRIHSFERISDFWSLYHSMPFPHLNASKPFPVGTIPAAVAALYTKDKALCLGL